MGCGCGASKAQRAVQGARNSKITKAAANQNSKIKEDPNMTEEQRKVAKLKRDAQIRALRLP